MLADREKRIKTELTRLKKLLKSAPPDRLKAVEGLLERAAFMRVEMEDLEAHVNRNGSVELGMHGSKVSAAAAQHNTLVKNYQAACKQLLDLLPDGKDTQSAGDALMEFVKKARR